jgi:hypothetical protein
MAMTIGFQARVAGSLALTGGLIWAFILGKNWLPIAPIVSGVVLYFSGIFGASDKISQSKGYSIFLLTISAVSALGSILSQLKVGFVATDMIGQLLFLAVLGWFFRELLAVVQSRR